MFLAKHMQPLFEQHEALRFEIGHRNAVAQDAVAALQRDMAEIAELEAKRRQCWSELHDYMAGIAGTETANRMFPLDGEG